MKGTNAELTFENLDFNGYYPVSARSYDGYQGFNFIDMGLITQKAVEWLGYGSGTGYTAVIGAGTTCAFTYINAFGQDNGFGEIRSSEKSETFNLYSGTFASAWESNEPVYFEALNAKGHVTAKVEVSLSQTATTINFANYGSDFSHISALAIVSEPGSQGNQGFTGYQIAMKNIYVHWNGKIPFQHPHAHVVAAAAMSAGPNHAWFDHGSMDHHDQGASHAYTYHGEIASLGDVLGHSDGGGGLTSQFALAHLDHVFGT